VKVIRILLTCLAVAAILALVVVLIAIAPAFQTWAAQEALSGKSGVQGTLGSLSAGFGEVDVEDLHLQSGGAVLTLPTLKAKLSLTDAVLRRKVQVRSLVAKGWTLDLTGMSAATDGQAQSGAGAGGAAVQAETHPEKRISRTLLGILGALRLPVDGTLDGVDLDGEILFSPLAGKPPAHVHVVVSGGGLGVGKEGSFAVDATGTLADSSIPINALAAHGSVAAAMDSSRTVSRVRVNAELTEGGGSAGGALTLVAEVSSDRASHELGYSVAISRGGRRLAAVLAHLPDGAHRLAGTWELNLQNGDLAPYFPDHPLPPSSLAGSGSFDSDEDFASVHALGTLSCDASHLGVLYPPLESAGAIALTSQFDATRSAGSVRVDHLSVSLAGNRPVATIKSAQVFSVDEATGSLGASAPGADLFVGSLRGLPLAWLSGLTGRFALSGGDATGDFLVRAADDGFELHSNAPFAAAGVTIGDSGKVIVQGVDLGLSLSGDTSARGWNLKWAPLSVSSAGRRIATLEGTASRPSGTGQAVAIGTTWDADLDALARQRAAPGLAWLQGRSASGSLTATVGSATGIDAKFEVKGHSAAQLFSGTLHADVDENGTVSFKAPVHFASGPSISDISLEGASGRDSGGPWVDVTLMSASVAPEHLRMLAAPFAPESADSGRDRTPFWGDWTGRLSASLDHVRTEAGELVDVGGVFTLDHGSIQLEGGRGGPAGHSLTNMTGSVAFDAAAEYPYSLKAGVAQTKEEAASILPTPKPGIDPVFEGKFTVDRTYTGKGVNLADLVARTQEEFRLASASGIVRILKADVADSLQEAPTPKAEDTLATVGSVVGSVMGARRNVLDSGKTKLSPTTEAVLDLTYQIEEIGYDSVKITAFKASDGVIRLVEIEMVSPEVRLRGTGQIAAARGIALADRALSLDLQLGAQGKTAELLKKAGLLTDRKDELGYSVFSQTIHLGGTLAQIDASQWNAVLIKAATPKPAGGKKGD
jgi:hypothetical protein